MSRYIIKNYVSKKVKITCNLNGESTFHAWFIVTKVQTLNLCLTEQAYLTRENSQTIHILWNTFQTFNSTKQRDNNTTMAKERTELVNNVFW